MIDIKINEINKIFGAKPLNEKDNTPVNGFSIDSRKIKSGDIFIAIKGKRFDGHDFLEEAAEKGASLLIISKKHKNAVPGKVLRVNNTIGAMARIAGYLRMKSGINIVAVTGTNGKTTVKEMIAHILSDKFNVLKSPASYNNIIGVSLTLFNLEDDHNLGVMEAGTNHPGEIGKIAKIIKPEAAVITNIGRGHLEYFKNREGVYKEKMTLAESLGKNGAVFLNGDDYMLSKCRVKNKKILVGTGKTCDFIIADVKNSGKGYDFKLNGMFFQLAVRGFHNIINASMSIAVSLSMGMTYVGIKRKLATFTLPSMRLTEEKREGITFIDDSYNANPDSFECAIKTLEDMKWKGRKIVVAGDMLELGSKSEHMHRTLGARIAAGNIDLLVTVGEKAADIARGAGENGMDRKKIISKLNMESAKRTVKSLFKKRDIVLLKASNSFKIGDIKKCYTTFSTR